MAGVPRGDPGVSSALEVFDPELSLLANLDLFFPGGPVELPGHVLQDKPLGPPTLARRDPTGILHGFGLRLPAHKSSSFPQWGLGWTTV